jgi:hypothetical protein
VLTPLFRLLLSFLLVLSALSANARLDLFSHSDEIPIQALPA